MTPKKRIESFTRLLQKKLPGVSSSVDAPSQEKGDWFVDVECDEQAFVVEYRPRIGFGLSSIPSGGYGEGPDEFFEDEAELVTRLLHLVRSKGKTVPKHVHLLQNLRYNRNVTQTEVASLLGVKQPSISKLERREDVTLSTLRRYVEALGGELHVTAKFAEGTVELGLGDGPEVSIR